MFKFKIGDEVKHKGYKLNMVVKARMEYEDEDSVGNYYDVFVFDNEKTPGSVDMVAEYWLEEGHRIE